MCTRHLDSANSISILNTKFDNGEVRPQGCRQIRPEPHEDFANLSRYHSFSAKDNAYFLGRFASGSATVQRYLRDMGASPFR